MPKPIERERTTTIFGLDTDSSFDISSVRFAKASVDVDDPLRKLLHVSYAANPEDTLLILRERVYYDVDGGILPDFTILGEDAERFYFKNDHPSDPLTRFSHLPDLLSGHVAPTHSTLSLIRAIPDYELAQFGASGLKLFVK